MSGVATHFFVYRMGICGMILKREEEVVDAGSR